MMLRKFNYKLVFKVQGALLLFESIFLLTVIPIAVYYDEQRTIGPFIFAALAALISGFIFLRIGKNALTDIGKREGSVIVTLIWILFSFIGLLPYWLSNSIPSLSNAFFETMSGFTATGATILTDIESLPHSILYWRSLTHWIGGLGIIVISMALLPVFGFSGVQLFSAEVTGPTKDKLHPKISETAKRLLLIYLCFTLIETVLLWRAGMSIFDAVCHSYSTVATGGFSTKQASIGYFNSPLIEIIIIVFMIASGVYFGLYYFLFKGKFRKVFLNEELRFFLLIVLSFTIGITLLQIDFTNFSWIDSKKIILDSLFTVSSLSSTTSFFTADYGQWIPATWILLFMLVIIGGSSGSTAGGVKVIRVVLVFKYCYYEFKRMIHPNAVIPIRFNRQIVKEEIITRVLAFMLLFFILVTLGSLILCISGLGFYDSISTMISCLTNVGPGLGRLGPISSYSIIPDFAKWFLCFVMLVGRLELFTVLLIFTPAFWKE